MRAKRAAVVGVSLMLLIVGSCDRDGNRENVPNNEAQELYDRARTLERQRVSEEDFREAEELYRQVITLDPDFARAHAGLARIHAGMVHFMYDPTEERRTQAREAALTALRMEPELGDAHYAMGAYWYWGRKQYDSAAAELEVASRAMPESGDVHAMAGFVERRRGNWQRALDYMKRAAELDAEAVSIDLANTYEALGHSEEALQAFAVAQGLRPDAHYEVGRSLVLLRRDGSTDSLRRALEGLPQDFDPDGTVTLARYELAWIGRNPEEALTALANSRRPVLQDQNIYLPTSLLAGRAHRMAGRTSQARAAFDSARTTLESAAEARPDDARVHVALASALAGLGDAAQAAQAAERSLTLMPRERDALIAQQIARHAAAVFADIGHSDRSIALLERVFAEPAVFAYSRRYLAIDPLWDKVRDRPGFQRIVSGVR